MPDFKSIDDIERDKAKREREELKENISNDINEVFGNLKKKMRDEQVKRKRARPFWKKLLLFLLWLGIFLLIINFVLGNFWLLKFFLKSLFGIG